MPAHLERVVCLIPAELQDAGLSDGVPDQAGKQGIHSSQCSNLDALAQD